MALARVGSEKYAVKNPPLHQYLRVLPSVFFRPWQAEGGEGYIKSGGSVLLSPIIRVISYGVLHVLGVVFIIGGGFARLTGDMVFTEARKHEAHIVIDFGGGTESVGNVRLGS